MPGARDSAGAVDSVKQKREGLCSSGVHVIDGGDI